MLKLRAGQAAALAVPITAFLAPQRTWDALVMSSVKFHPGWAGKLEEQWQQQSCWLVLAAERVQQRGDDGLWS